MGLPASSPRGRFDGRVLENRLICLDHYLLRVGLDRFPPTRPGQFVNIRCGDDSVVPSGAILEWRIAPAGREGSSPSDPPLPRGAINTATIKSAAPIAPPGRGGSGAGSAPLPRETVHQPELAGRQPLLRRPISLAGRADRPDGSVELEIIYHVIGVGTAWLAERAVGSPIDVLGPLGNGFRLPGPGPGNGPPTAPPGAPLAVLVGGGVGIPPLLYLAETLAAAGVETVAFAGARSRAALPLTIDPSEPPSQAGWPTLCTAEFAARRTPTVVATDDGSLGVTGFVHEPLERWLAETANSKSENRNSKQTRNSNSEKPNNTETANTKSQISNLRSDISNLKSVIVYACGPPAMLRAVAKVCAAAGVPCQAAVERHMACGMGTCQSCVVKVRAEGGPGWTFKLACKDGPVFPAEDLVWE